MRTRRKLQGKQRHPEGASRESTRIPDSWENPKSPARMVGCQWICPVRDIMPDNANNNKTNNYIINKKKEKPHAWLVMIVVDPNIQLTQIAGIGWLWSVSALNLPASKTRTQTTCEMALIGWAAEQCWIVSKLYIQKAICNKNPTPTTWNRSNLSRKRRRRNSPSNSAIHTVFACIGSARTAAKSWQRAPFYAPESLFFL